MCVRDGNSDAHCYPHGNFFISEGKPGQVLKVRAKKRIVLQFLTALQCTLEKKYSNDTYPKLIGKKNNIIKYFSFYIIDKFYQF